MTPRALRQAPRRPLHLLIGAIVTVVSSFYTVFFAWWLDPFLRNRADVEFQRRIAPAMDTLFGSHGVMWVPNDPEDKKLSRVFNLAFATATSPDFDLRFQQFQDELSLFVRPSDRSASWTEAWTILDGFDFDNTKLQRWYHVSLAWDAAEMLQRNWHRLAHSMQGKAAE